MIYRVHSEKAIVCVKINNKQTNNLNKYILKDYRKVNRYSNDNIQFKYSYIETGKISKLYFES